MYIAISGTLWLELSVGVLVVAIAIGLVSIPEFLSSNPGSKGTPITIANPVKIQLIQNFYIIFLFDKNNNNVFCTHKDSYLTRNINHITSKLRSLEN